MIQNDNNQRFHHRDGFFESHDQVQLYYQRWLPQGSVKAMIGIVHGLGGHSGMFSTVVEYLVPHGYGIYGLDLRGHGRSPGQRGYIKRWSDFRIDIQCFLQFIAHNHPNMPLFLWGHSLGGLIVLDAVLHDSMGLNGIVITAPALDTDSVSPVRLVIGTLLSRIWPRFSLNTGLGNIPGSRDPDAVKAMNHDPLRHYLGTARLATEFSQTAQWVRAHADQLKIPTLILHGSDDQIASPQPIQDFFEQIPILDKKRQEYDGGYHEIHIDINHQEVLNDVLVWLDQHLIPKSCAQPLRSQEINHDLRS